MKITRDETRRIADLARLEFDDTSLDRMAGEMTKILEYIEQLKDVDTDAGDGAVASSATPFRDDEVQASLDRRLVEENAPEWRDGFFVVPKVIGD